MINDHINLYIVRFRHHHGYTLSGMVTLGVILVLMILQSVVYIIINIVIWSHVGYTWLVL